MLPPSLRVYGPDGVARVELETRHDVHPLDDSLPIADDRFRDRPDPGGPVPGARDHHAPVRAERGRRHLPLLSKRRTDRPPGRRVPEPSRVTATAGDDGAAV